MAHFALLAPLRSLRVQAPRSAPLMSRGIHASVPVMRKKPAPAEEAFEEDEEVEEDLFASTPSTSSTYKLDKPAIRRSNLDRIVKHARLSPKDRKKDKVPTQAVRQVVACSEQGEINEIKKVVRSARVGGVKVSKRAAAELVGRCVNLGKPKLASELISNYDHYGLPDLDQVTLIKLHHALLSTSQPLPSLSPSQPISPTLSLLRLSLLHKSASATPSHEEVAAAGAASGKVRKFRETRDVEQWKEAAKKTLIGAGGVWEEAVNKLEAGA